MSVSGHLAEWLRVLLSRIAYVIAFPGIFIVAWYVFTDYILRLIVMPHSWRQIAAVPLAAIVVALFWGFLKNVWFKRWEDDT